MNVIRFELPLVTPTLNELQRRHYHRRTKDRRALAWEIRLALGPQRPAKPFTRAHVLIERYSRGTPDRDNLLGGMKDLVDCLLDPAPRLVKGKVEALHPTGLGLVKDDAPAHMILDGRALKVGHRDPVRTVVTITELDLLPEPSPK